MDKQAQILAFASETFDVAGANGNILILGLETRPDRDIDAFATDGKQYCFIGFRKHFAPKIKATIEQINALGHRAKQLRYSGNVNMKRLAIVAGLGAWGKNSMVLHPRFGTRLRFGALELDITLSTEVHDERTIFAGCANCDACIRACPLNLLRPFALTEKEKCQAYLDLDDPTKTQRCDLCQIACPH
ncbi:hypothetical protein HY932_02785 [Candidatus Falkowbacteria bacterium]|nr:hypothetical protein [Candidatus Falkowbacteria bacterium]